MKLAIKFLGYLSLVFVVFSITFFIASCIDLRESILLNENFTLKKGYDILSNYSDLFKFTIIVSAFWVTIRQLNLSLINSKATLDQIEFVQKDIESKRDKEINDATLKHCKYFFEDLQPKIKDLCEQHILSGTPTIWSGFEFYTSSELKKKYPRLHERMSDEKREKKNLLILTLYTIESFAAQINYGSYNKKLLINLIGFQYTNQIDFLLGSIAFFRSDKDAIFGKNTIELYKDWINSPELTAVPEETTMEIETAKP